MRINKLLPYIGSLLLLAALTSCQKELDVRPENGNFTPEMVQEAVEALDGRSNATLSGMLGRMKTLTAARNDALYGLPSTLLRWDGKCNSYYSVHDDYDHFIPSITYQAFEETFFTTTYDYGIFYQYIKAANDNLRTTTPDPKAEDVKSLRGQSLAFRAYSYFMLIQGYQFTYKGNENKPGVPMVLESTPVETLTDMKRSTVQEVYDQILKDLKEAEILLKGISVSNVSYISEYVVKGLLARVYLVMKDYTNAAKYAKEVIDGSKKTPYALNEADRPAFQDVNDHNVLWGLIYTKDDRASSTLRNPTSQLCVFPGMLRYASVAPHCLNPVVYNHMLGDDVRKNWFFTNISGDDEDLKGLISFYTKVLKLTEENAKKAIPAVLKEMPKTIRHGCCKYAPPSNSVDLVENSGDFPLMRIEEMYYILGEAQYLGGDQATGTTTLEDFIKKYRSPSFSLATALTNPHLSKETDPFKKWLYEERQIEFFAEGFAYHDLMRLELDMVRSDTKENDKTDVYKGRQRFDLKKDDPRLLLLFPQSETQLNRALQQNTIRPIPSKPEF